MTDTTNAGAGPSRRNTLIAIAAVLAIILAGTVLLFLLQSGPGTGETPLPVVVGQRPYEANALFTIAQDEGYFEKNGLNVTLKDYPSVTRAFDGVSNREADLGLASEFVVAGRILKNENLTLIASVDRFQTLFLIGRRDRGIRNISDLKGKRIGLTRNSISEFFLARYLGHEGMSIRDVVLIDAPPADQLPALASGNVDALVAGEHIDSLREQFGDTIVIWPVQENQAAHIVVAGRGDWVSGHPEEVNRLLASLDQAGQFVIGHPGEAKAIIWSRLNYTDTYNEEVWSYHRPGLSLDQSLLIALNDEARWMVINNLTAEKTIPDFPSFISTKGLGIVKPAAVNLR